MVMVLGKDLEAALASVGLNLVTRAEAGLRPPDYRNAMPTPSPRFYDHHAAVESTDDAQEWRAHQAYHMDHNGWSDIAYNFGIPDPNPNKIVFEGRGVGVQGGHTQGENTESHAFCALGNFQVDRPSANTLEVAAQLMALGIRKKWWNNHILGHRDAPGATTSCPGQYWYEKLPWLRSRVNQILAGGTPPPTTGDWFDMATEAQLDKLLVKRTSPYLVRSILPNGQPGPAVFILAGDLMSKWWIGGWENVAIAHYVEKLNVEADNWKNPIDVPAAFLDQVPELENPVIGKSTDPKPDWKERLEALRPQ